ncbi:MAG: Protoporphyrinogen IX oxidase, aerobic, HemY [uncultured Nocardioidaceae bacterium]|uniref:Coproporphyrinogen III oxidase n=1 Tax=uncultured Nocardioidaceae bacterium TaxID=253824 RepID=A0A6J4LC79_9ACTN|nr:MAG: Protoporphyrinogen IX oxidase, aerobic, HemY [uncultured Nocardioidaceae bacterium]
MVGAGISGLAAAAALGDRGVPVTVFEGSPRIGGKLSLAEVGGITVDVGAEAMLNRRPEATALARRCGLADRLVHPATTAASLWSRGEMRPLPRTVMGVPADARALVASRVVSRRGLARAAVEVALPSTRLHSTDDLSVADLVGRRFGAEVVDRLVEPLLGGVYAGHARELSARATVPQVVALLDKERSMLRAATSVAGSRVDDVPVFAGLVGGVGRLPEAVARSAGIEVRTDTSVRRLARRATGWELEVGSAHAPEVVSADIVVLATPARPTSRLLRDVAPAAAAELAGIEYASMAVVSLVFRTGDLPQTTGSGFLVPPVDRRDVKAATYSFAKWDWVREAGRAGDDGDDLLMLRCSIGRHREEHVLQAADEDLVRLALADLGDAIGLEARPVDALVTRWGGALPQYAVGHPERVRRIRFSVEQLPGLAVCGAAYDGLGIPACIASADRAATQVLDGLASRGEWTRD